MLEVRRFYPLLEEAVRLLAQEMDYDVPPESLKIDRRTPALPANGFLIRNVRGASVTADAVAGVTPAG